MSLLRLGGFKWDSISHERDTLIKINLLSITIIILNLNDTKQRNLRKN